MAEPPRRPCVTCGAKLALPLPPVCAICGNRPGAPAGSRAVLRVGASGTPIPLPDCTEVTFGRMSTDDRIGEALNPYDHVGREHARVTVRGTRVTVLDLDSKHGTYVNGRCLAPNEEIEVDLPVVIRLGPHCNAQVGPAR